MTVRREITKPRRETDGRSPEDLRRTRAVRRRPEGRTADRRAVAKADRRWQQKAHESCGLVLVCSLSVISRQHR